MSSRLSKRFTGFLSRSKSQATSSSSNNEVYIDDAGAETPEANATRSIRSFCEHGRPSTGGGDEVLHLPVIVEATESSPAAATAAAKQIRKYLTKDWAQKAEVQYNAIMLIRILSDHPGPIFTCNFDKAFVSSVKDTLRNSKDPSSQQLLRETLDTLEVNKQNQVGVDALISMWRKEKGQQASLSHSVTQRTQVPASGGQGYALGGYEQQRQQGYGGSRQLPPPAELASRIEEARNTAKILLQLIQSTPPEEVVSNDLMREFSERCQSAQRSMQGYINCDNPPPSDDTMLTLIETNEQLSLASSRHHRYVLAARKAMGSTPSPNPEAQAFQNGASLPTGPPILPSPPPQNTSLFASPTHSNTVSAFATNNNAYQAPSSPPADALNRLNSQESGPNSPSKSTHDSPKQQPRTLFQPAPTVDPFADPVEYDSNAAPVSTEPEHYGSSISTGFRATPTVPAAQTFSIDSEPSFAPMNRRNTSDLENAYSRNTVPSTAPPGMNGVSDNREGVVEIDGHPEVGRTEQPDDETSSQYDASPIQSRNHLP